MRAVKKILDSAGLKTQMNMGFFVILNEYPFHVGPMPPRLKQCRPYFPRTYLYEGVSGSVTAASVLIYRK